MYTVVWPAHINVLVVICLGTCEGDGRVESWEAVDSFTSGSKDLLYSGRPRLTFLNVRSLLEIHRPLRR